MQSILQLCNAKEFKEGDIPLIRHFIFPQPLIPYLKRPNSTLSRVEGNIPKYEIEMANAARLLCLNSSTKDSKLGTFISSTETVGFEEDLTCVDPVRLAISYSIILRLRNVPNTYQSAHTTKCHLLEKMTWMSMDRSHAGALTFADLGRVLCHPAHRHPPLS